MLVLLLLALALLCILYMKLVVSLLYWRQRGIFYVMPWSRFYRVYLSKQTFVDSVKEAYNEFPDKRYYGSYQFLRPSLFVRDVDLIKRITVKDFEHFTDHMGLTSDKTDPVLGLNLFSLKGQKWREMRSTLSPAFTTSKMKIMFGLISETARDFTDHFLNRPEETAVLDMRGTYSKYTNDVIANCAFGIKCRSLEDETDRFYQMGRAITTPTLGRIARTLGYNFFPKIFQFFKIPVLQPDISDFFLRTIKKTIEVREREGVVRPDMIHLLMEARKGQLKSETSDSGTDAGYATVQESDLGKTRALDLTDEAITAQALVFFIAGLSTASSIMSFMSYELVVHPEIQDRLHKEIDEILAETPDGTASYDHILKMKYLDQVVSETLRKWPPGYVLTRVCVKDYTIPPKNRGEKAAVIEKGCLVAIPAIALHYCPDLFPDPDRFDPDRFSEENRSKIVPGSYMPFGLGPRNCIGSRFALLEIKALMASLLSKFRIVPVEKTVIPLQLSKSLALEAKGGIWLGLKRRNGTN